MFGICRTLSLVMACALLLNGCAEQGPSSPSSQRVLAPDETPASPAPSGIPASQFEPLRFRGALQAAKVTTDAVVVKKLISAKQGGQLLLDWEIKDEHGVTGSKIKVEVKILPKALSQDTEISISLENPAYAMVRVDFTFGPEGTQFNKSAEVKMDLEGLDLSSYDDPDAIGCYWYDPDSGSWFPVLWQYKEVDLTQGKVEGLWYFEHFSVYSLSGGGTK